MNAPVIRKGLIPIENPHCPSDMGFLLEFVTLGFASTYRASARNIARLKSKIKRLKREIKTASRGRKFRLRKRLARAQRRLERIQRVVRKRVERRKAKGKDLTRRQKRLLAALKRGGSRKKKKLLRARIEKLRAEAEAEAKAAEQEDENFASELEDELEGEPEPEEYEDEMPIEQALEPEEKKLYERPEVLAIGAVVILGGIFLVTRQRG
tara:strand:- start:4 stop:633 length:630 start_codon:yes stop_codon:yes gene_type:complete